VTYLIITIPLSFITGGGNTVTSLTACTKEEGRAVIPFL
jgi:hypothetical protein